MRFQDPLILATLGLYLTIYKLYCIGRYDSDLIAPDLDTILEIRLLVREINNPAVSQH